MQKYLRQIRQLFHVFCRTDRPAEIESYPQAALDNISDVSVLMREKSDLQAALEEARTENAARNQMLSSVSHELRTPLNAIMGFSELLLLENSQLDEAQRREYLKDIHHSSSLLLLLVNDVLDFAKLESNQLKIDKRSINLCELIKSCLRMLEPEFARKALNIRVQYDETIWVNADAMRLQQVLLNLLSNACKYNRAGGCIDVQVASTRVGEASITIADTGIGIAPEKIGQLFSPFVRLHNLALSIDSTGLGLSISKKILALMQGDISYRPNPDGGSIFMLTIPRGLPPEVTVAGCERDEAALSLSPDLKVLYVEDNAINIRLMRAMLWQLGVDCDAVNSGEEALVYLGDRQPDVILMDINLPGICGRETALRIRNTPAYATIPIIAVSASLDVALDGDSRLFAARIGKPFRMEKVHAVLKKAVNWQPV